MEEWPVDEKEVMKILVEVATSKREAEIVSTFDFYLYQYKKGWSLHMF